MKKPALTPKEKELLAIIHKHKKVVLPTMRELAVLAGVASPSTIHGRLHSLRRKGMLA